MKPNPYYVLLLVFLVPLAYLGGVFVGSAGAQPAPTPPAVEGCPPCPVCETCPPPCPVPSPEVQDAVKKALDAIKAAEQVGQQQTQGPPQ